MKKLLTAVLVALSVTAFSKSAFAVPTDPFSFVWNIDFTGTSLNAQFDGFAYVPPTGGGSTPPADWWNFYYDDIDPTLTPVSAGGQSWDSRGTTFGATGTISYQAQSQSTPATSGTGDDISGFITAGPTPIDVVFNGGASAPVTSGWIYVYTEQLKTSPDFTNVYNNGTATTTVTNRFLAGSDTVGGHTYDVYKYDVSTTKSGYINLRTVTLGQIAAMQLVPVPEPNSAMLLGIGGLIGAVMLRRKYAVEA